MAPDVKCVGTKPEDKVCKNSNGAGACVPIPLGIEGVLDIGSLLASFAPGLTAKVTLAAEIGGANPNYVSDQGINMRLMGEVKSDHNICVPQTQPPMPSGASITYGNNSALCLRCTKAGDPCPSGSTCDENHMQCRKGDGTCPTVNYMAGIGINEYMVSKVLWAAFNSGALCLNIGSDTPGVSDYLTAGALAVFMPELKENIGGNAPAALALKPQMAPVLKVGAGIVKHDEKGNITLAKPLLSLNLPQVSIDFYVAMYDRYTRIFTVTTDIEVPVGLDIAPSKTKPGVIEILPIVSGLNLANAQITNWEIMAFPPDFIGLVNALVGQLLPSLLKPIEVDLSSSLQGFTLELLGIRGEVPFNPPRPEGCNDTDDDPKTACNYQFLSVYANLGLAAVNAAPVVTRAEVVSMAIPPVEKIRLMGTARGDAPVVHVRAAGDQDNLEFSYRIDSGLWSFYSPGPDVMVTGPALALPGRHSIEVRGRVVNMPYTTDLEGVKMEVTIDYTPPDISFSRAGDGSVTVNAVDLVSKEKVRVYYRASGTEDWIEIANGSVLPVVEGGKVEVRAVDEAGREAFAITAVGVKQTPSDRIGKADVSTSASGETAAGVDAAGCGCSTVSVEGQGATGLAGLLMALAALIAARRR
jgi:uncharacterized protein (TIGR03382 family)